MYQPKKQRYNDLRSLYKEMKENGHKVQNFDGMKIYTKKANYGLVDGTVVIWKL